MPVAPIGPAVGIALAGVLRLGLGTMTSAALASLFAGSQRRCYCRGFVLPHLLVCWLAACGGLHEGPPITDPQHRALDLNAQS